jgi:uncharacterized protein
MKKMRLFLSAALCAISMSCYSQDTLHAPHVEAILYTGKGGNQPLIVGLGGSEGGNAWASDYWSKTRQRFIDEGYAFLAVGYFGCKSTPPVLDRISIDDVHQAIAEAAKNKNVNAGKIAIVGGSRGADLALLLGSHYDDISCVVAMSPSHAVFPGHTQEFTTSCWTFGGKELPFIPVNEESVPFLMKRDLRGAFQAMMKDTASEQKALIPVERIQGSVLLMSATKDEIIPAVEMGKKMMARFRNNDFKYAFEHTILEGSHAETTRHFDKIFDFLAAHFK